MRKLTIFKSLLVVAGLCVGASAWAGDITSLPANYVLNTGSSIDPFDAGTIKTGTNVIALNVNNTTATAWFNTDGYRAPYTLATDEEVTISFTAYHGWNGNGANQGVKLLNSGGHTIAEYIYNLGSCTLTAVNIGESTATGWSSAYNCQSRYNSSKNANGFAGGTSSQAYQTTAGYNPVFTFKIRYDGYVSLNVYYPNHKDGSIDNTYSGSLPDGWAVDLQKIQVYSGTNNDDRTIAINNLNISSEIAERHTVTFTYEDTDGNSLSALKANSTIQAVEGTNIESLITGSLTATFYNGDASIRYDYSTYDASGATTVPASDITVKLKFAPKAKFTHGAQAVEKDNTSNVLKPDLASGYAYAGEDLKLHWSKYVYANSKWYGTTTLTGTYTTSGTTDIEFSSSDINYFFEFENLSKEGSFGATTSGDGLSNNGSARLAKNSRTWTTAIAAGTYTLNIYCYGENAKAPTLPMYYCDTDGSNLVYIGEATACRASNWELKEKTGIVIPDGKALCFYNTDGKYNSNYLVDYFTLTRTGDATVSATIGDTGWTTFASPYALDLSGMTASEGTVTAYYARSVGSNSVTMTSTDKSDVIEGEGLMLNGTVGATITIPVVASGTAIDGNKLVGCTTSTNLAKNASYYVLVNEGGTAMFQSLEEHDATIPAGKAYLDAGKAAARLSIVFEDETTGVADVRSKTADVRNEFYNLNGQRIQNPTKGLYIVNGKKVVVK